VPLAGLLLLAVAAPNTFATARARGQPAVSDLRIEVSESERTTLVGDSFTFTSTISNDGSDATPTLIANLDFVSVDHSTYVDPEDWSPERTLIVAPIDAGASATQSWTINTVLQGKVAAYVVVLPDATQPTAIDRLATSPPIYMHVSEQRKLNPGGVLPVVLIVPGLIAAAFTGLQVSRRRR
jgi:hypothetical protein